MQITLGQIVSNEENITELAKVKLPIKVSYKIGKLLGKIESEIKFYQEKRNELFKEFGEPVEGKPGVFQVKLENTETLKEEINKLENIQVEINIDKIKIEELGDMQIEPKLLINWLFE